ncbi:MAG: hypothetical protein U0V87_06570 [Acidobacteriota bacterium]
MNQTATVFLYAPMIADPLLVSIAIQFWYTFRRSKSIVYCDPSH